MPNEMVGILDRSWILMKAALKSAETVHRHKIVSAVVSIRAMRYCIDLPISSGIPSLGLDMECITC